MGCHCKIILLLLLLKLFVPLRKEKQIQQSVPKSGNFIEFHHTNAFWFLSFLENSKLVGWLVRKDAQEARGSSKHFIRRHGHTYVLTYFFEIKKQMFKISFQIGQITIGRLYPWPKTKGCFPITTSRPDAFHHRAGLILCLNKNSGRICLQIRRPR